MIQLLVDEMETAVLNDILERKQRRMAHAVKFIWEGIQWIRRGKEEVCMATSSITKNFIISGQKQVEMFADAIEASANDRTPRVPINVTYLQGTEDILKFMERREKVNVGQR